MRDYESTELDALANRRGVMRMLLWVAAKDRATGAPAPKGFSNLVRHHTITVIDGRTGAETARLFTGLGRALKMPDIAVISQLTVRTVEIVLPATDAVVEAMVRGDDVRGAPMELYLALIDPDTRALVAPPRSLFTGFVDGAPIETPRAGGTGTVRIQCVDGTRELTRGSPEVRSHESQLARSGGTDGCYRDTAVVGQWQIPWGENRVRPVSADKGGPG